MIVAPASFSLSRTWFASALTCRFESAEAMIERVVEAGLLADVEHCDVAGLDVFERRDGDLLQLVKTHAGRYGRM